MATKKPRRIWSIIAGMLNTVSYILLIVGLSLIISTFAILVANDVLALIKDGGEVTVELSDDSTPQEVGLLLQQQEIIEYPWAFELFSMLKKVEVFEAVFKGQISEEMLGFITLVVNKERYTELPKIFRYLVDRIKEEKKIGIAYVTTAVELSDAKKQNVENRLLQTTQYKTMEMHYAVDESLIGGMVIRIKDRVVDSSVRTKLEEMKKQLLQIQLG